MRLCAGIIDLDVFTCANLGIDIDQQSLVFHEDNDSVKISENSREQVKDYFYMLIDQRTSKQVNMYDEKDRVDIYIDDDHGLEYIGSIFFYVLNKMRIKE